MAISDVIQRARRRSEQTPEAELITALRHELVERATTHEVLAAQRTDLVVDQLWRRLEASDARLATAVQLLEDRVAALEAKAGGDLSSSRGSSHPPG